MGSAGRQAPVLARQRRGRAGEEGDRDGCPRSHGPAFFRNARRRRFGAGKRQVTQAIFGAARSGQAGLACSRSALACNDNNESARGTYRAVDGRHPIDWVGLVDFFFCLLVLTAASPLLPTKITSHSATIREMNNATEAYPRACHHGSRSGTEIS